jgi:adenosylhomocysteine nucleosidase
MTRVAIIAAMPGELKPLVRGWPSSTRDNVHFWAQRSEEEEWMAACAGTGQAAATRAFAAIEAGGPIDLVISYGWVGALTVDVAPGSAHNIAGVIDARTGERFNCDAGSGERWLVTSPIVANEAEKQRLASTYAETYRPASRAQLVDMEAAAIARLAQMRGIPFYCFKGVSDGFKDKLPDFNRFIRADGRFDLTGMVLFSILRPWHWPSLIQMGENSSKASLSLRDSLLNFLDGRGDIGQRNGYPNLKH